MAPRTQICLTLLLLFLAACGGTAVPEPTVIPPTLDPDAQLGKQVFTRECATCHSTTPDTIIVGPSLAGIATKASERVEGQDDYTYLLISIMQPGDYLVEGYQDLMPASLGKNLTGEEIDGVIAYLLTLR